MPSISEVADQELFWAARPSRGKDYYELRAGSDIIGTLSFGRGTEAQAVGAGRQWIFKREGFWRQRVTVRIPGSDDPVALLRLGWLAIWKSEATWSEDDRLLVRFKSRGVWKPRNSVKIDPGARHLRDLPLLVLLGFYCIRLRAEDIANAGAGA